MAERKLRDLKVLLAQLEERVKDKVPSANKQRDRDQMARMEHSINELKNHKIPAAEREVAEQARKQAQRASKAANKASDVAVTKPMSSKGVQTLVRLKYKYNNRFLNNSDTNESVWKVIADEFNQLVEDGSDDVEPSDARDWEALRRRCAPPPTIASIVCASHCTCVALQVQH